MTHYFSRGAWIENRSVIWVLDWSDNYNVFKLLMEKYDEANPNDISDWEKQGLCILVDSTVNLKVRLFLISNRDLFEA